MGDADTTDPGATAQFLDRIRGDLAASRRLRLGALAVARGLVTQAQLDETPALAPLEETLVARGWLRPSQLEELLEDLDGLRRRGDPGAPRYEVGAKLGEGAVSVVHRGTDRELGRPVALKFLKDSLLAHGKVRERFHREAQSLARMDHPHVVRVHDVGRVDGRLALVMELVEGEPFGRTARPLREAVALLEQAARGVHHAHEKGVVHRDLKPDNILVGRDGAAKVADFGLAHLAESGPALTHTGSVLGTPMYMAPEQVRGRHEITPRTDVYALGAILYQVLTGRPPHEAQSVSEVYDKILRDDPVPPRKLVPTLPWELDAVALRALEKDPARRYPSAFAFAEELRRFLAGEAVEARPVSTLARAWRRAARNPLRIALVVALFVAAGFALDSRARARRGELAARAGDFLESARTHLERGALDAARDLVEQALATAPDLPLAHLRRGEVWEAGGFTAQAEACFRRAAELDPRPGPAHYRLGRVLLRRAYLASINMWTAEDPAERDEAERLAREGAAHLETAAGFEDEVRREIAAAMLAWLRRDLPGARRICAEGIRKFGSRDGVEELHWLDGLSRSKPAEEIPCYDAALALRPRFALALYSRAWALPRVGKSGDADFDAAILAAPGFAEPYIFRGSHRLVKGDAAGARADFDTLIGMGVHLAPAHNGRAGVRLKLDRDWDGAIADATEAIRRKPEGYHIPWMYRAEAKLMKGDAEGAIADATRALEILKGKDGGQTPYAIRGRARAARGDRAGALEDLRKSGPAGAPFLKELEGAQK